MSPQPTDAGTRMSPSPPGRGRTPPVALRRWLARVHAYVGTDGIRVELQRRSVAGWRAVRTVHQRVDTTGGVGFAAALAALQAALTELRTAPADAAPADFGGAACLAIVADAYLLYDVIPLDLAALSTALAERAVGATLGEVAGTAPQALCVRWRPQRGGRTALAVAMAKADLDGLRTVVAQQGLRLRSVTGEMLAVLATHRRALPAAPAVVAVARASGTQIAALRGPVLATVHFESGRADAAAIAASARRAIRLHGLADDEAFEVRIDCDAPIELPPDARGWDLWPRAAWLPA